MKTQKEKKCDTCGANKGFSAFSRINTHDKYSPTSDTCRKCVTRKGFKPGDTYPCGTKKNQKQITEDRFMSIAEKSFLLGVAA